MIDSFVDGTPPCKHLDVIVMTDKEYEPGDEDRIKIIGVFKRNDGDHKLVGVLEDRDMNDISEYFNNKKRKTIMMVQHTESQHHINGMIGAWGDWELTERGKKQAYEVGKWLLHHDCDKSFMMYVSDLKRALQTAQEINKTLGITPIVTSAIREVNAGRGNGQSREWYNSNKKPSCDCYDPDYKPFEDAESDRDLWNRLYPFYQEIVSNREEKILIVSHGTALSFLQSMLMGDTFEDIAKRRFIGVGGAVSKITIEAYGKVVADYINQRVWYT